MGEITLGQIQAVLVLLASIITSGGVIVKFVTKNYNKKLNDSLDIALKPLREQQHRVEDKIDGLEANMRINNLGTARIDLLQAILHTPNEHQAILRLAEHYFIELGGNSYMYNIFIEWANKQSIDIAYITERIDGRGHER